MEKKLYIAMLLVYIGAGVTIAYRSYQIQPGPSNDELLQAIENGAANVLREQAEVLAAAKASEN